MSDFRAIAGVSSTLKTLLRDRMEDTVDVTIAPPDVPVSVTGGRRLNLYLYQIAENGSLKNQEIPGQGNPGGYGHPPLSLDLHYLLTAYIESEAEPTADLQSQQIMGDAMRVLHDFPIVTGGLAITNSAAGEVGTPVLNPSLLAEFERVKITLQPTTLEDFSKLWTALPQANFRRSVAYHVSVVQIESQRARQMAMPVKTRRIHITTLRRPEIGAVYRSVSPNEPVGDLRVKLGESITIEGANFIGGKTWVRIEGLEPIRITPVSNERIQIEIPDDEYPADADHPNVRPIPTALQLWPGAQRVEILTERVTEVVEGALDTGKLVADDKILRSNHGVFLLVPEIATVDPSEAATADLPDALLTVNGTRLYRQGLKSFVLVGDVAIEVRRPVASGDWFEPEETVVQVPAKALSVLPPAPNEPYPVRMLVNGAQSLEEGIGFTLLP